MYLTESQPHKSHLTSNLNYRRFPSYLLCTFLLYFFFIFYLHRCTLPDFPSVSSLVSLPFLPCYHRTTTTNNLHEDVPERGGTSLKSLNRIQENSSHKIPIIKKKACPSISWRNIGDHLKRGMLTFENDSNLSQKQCLEYLNENLLECKSAISKAVVKDFLPDRSFNMS